MRSRLGLICILLLGGCDVEAPVERSANPATKEAIPVILISIDTLRSDHLPVYGYDGVETPAIDALRRDGVLFERAYTHAPTTLPSHTSLLTGHIQTVHGVRDNAGYRLAPDVDFLPEILRRAGYRTSAAVSTYVLRKDTGLSRGFDLYDDGIDSNATTSLWGAERRGEKTLEVALEALDAAPEKPPFLFFHIYEPHLPYSPPEPFATRYGLTYEGEIAAADAVIGDLLEALRKRSLYERALIVLLSDHGEGFGDHHEKGHGVFLYRETLQVPLLLKLPDALHAGESVTTPVALVDVLPTVLDVLGFTPPTTLDGISLLRVLSDEDLPPRGLFSETLYPRLHFGWSDLASLIRGRYHYIEAPEPELYDLLDDPREERNILREERRVYSEMRDLLAGSRKPFEQPLQEDDETARQLAALGYLSAGGAANAEDGPLADPKTEMARNADRLDRAFGLTSEGRFDEAIPIFRELLGENPLMTDVWGNLGAALRKTGQLEEALEAYRKALELSHGSPEGAIFVGRVLLDLRRFDEARSHAELALEWNPRLAHDLLGEIALASGDLDDALRWARAEPPAGHEMRRRLAMLLAARGRGAEAEPLLEALVKEFPDAAPALSALAMLRLGTGRADEAAQLLERALAADPKSPLALENRGLLALQQGRLGPARDDLERAVEIDPRAANAWNLLAVARYQNGDIPGALGAWSRAIEVDPKQFDALYNLAFTAADSGDGHLARRALRQYIDTAPPQMYGREIRQAQERLHLLENR